MDKTKFKDPLLDPSVARGTKHRPSVGLTPSGTPTPYAYQTADGSANLNPGLTEQWEDPELLVVKLPETLQFEKTRDITGFAKIHKESLMNMEDTLNKTVQDLEK